MHERLFSKVSGLETGPLISLCLLYIAFRCCLIYPLNGCYMVPTCFPPPPKKGQEQAWPKRVSLDKCMFKEVHTGWQVSVGHLLHDSLLFSVFIYFYYKKRFSGSMLCPARNSQAGRHASGINLGARQAQDWGLVFLFLSSRNPSNVLLNEQCQKCALSQSN